MLFNIKHYEKYTKRDLNYKVKSLDFFWGGYDTEEKPSIHTVPL